MSRVIASPAVRAHSPLAPVSARTLSEGDGSCDGSTLSEGEPLGVYDGV